MSANDNQLLLDSVLSALETGEEYLGRARGDDAAKPGYILEELEIPEAAIPTAGVTGRAAIAKPSRSAAYVEDESYTGEDSAEDAGRPGFSRSESTSGVLSSQQRVTASMPVTLVSINEDGSDGPRIDLRYNDSIIGRAGDIRFPTDAFLSPKHARFSIEGNRLFIEDLYSLNGTYVKLREETRLTPGDTFLMGRQVLRFEKFEHQIVPKARASDGTRYMGSPPPTGHFKLIQVGIGGITQNIYCLHDSGAIIGREKGDIIFPRDKFMSGRHAQIYPRDDGHYYLVDLSSSNGTWIKIWERREVRGGDFVFLGQQLFRLEIG